MVIISSLYLGLYAYRVLGNRSLSFEDALLYLPGPPKFAGACPSSNPAVVCGGPDGVGGIVGGGDNGIADGYSASWEYEANPWIFRTGIGFRFHWVGFER